MTWLDLPADHPFGIHNLPYGVFSTAGTEPRVGRAGRRPRARRRRVRRAGRHGVGRRVAGPVAQRVPRRRAARPGRAAREWLTEQLTNEAHRECVEAHLVPVDEVTMHLPVEVADYVDFYASEHHATNVGRIFRPDSEPLTPNWKHLPIGYHGRSGTVVVSGTDVVRPSGQRKPPTEPVPVFGPSVRLDIEAELGLRRRRRHPPRRAGAARGCRRPPLRGRPPQRLVGARPPGLGVRAARPVPRQVVRDLDLPVGRHHRRAAGRPGAAARAGPRAAALPAR